MSSIPNVIADFSTILALKVAVGDTTATLVSATDSDGVALPTGTYGFTIDRKNSSKEYITCTLTGTALTNISTIAVGTGIASTGFARAHRRSAEVVLTDFVAIKRIQDVLESGYPSAVTPSTDYQLATKKYVDDLALGGATTVDRVTLAGIAGETLVAGNLVYLKVADARWWKVDADDVTTIDGVMMGIAQGSGTAGNAITSGVLVKGVDANQSALSAHTLYYASNTAGAISATSGTFTRVLGVSHPTTATKLYFDPDFQKLYKNYAVDSVGTDAYAITLQSAFGALYAGMEVTFKAGTANTGGATLAVNGLTAKAITKYGGTALDTGDILAGQVVKVIYDGTNFEILSSLKSSPDIQTFTTDGTWTKPSVSANSRVIIELWGGGAGGASGNVQNGGGGGGGGYTRVELPISSLGATATVSLGAAGASGVDGGNTTFGSYATAYGGGRGASGGTPNPGKGLTTSFGGGGGGGGPNGSLGGGYGAGAAATANFSAGASFFGGGGGGWGATGGDSYYGGGGGGGINSTSAGGASVFGGGGGGGGTGGAAGTSTFGGRGGTGGSPGAPGIVPGGGGGKGANGATGQAIITTIN